MGMCNQCHRETTCLHEHPITIKEMYFLIGFIVFFSQIGFVIFYGLIDSRDVVGISLISYGALVIILMYMFLMYLLLDKQYLALFFGCHQQKERSLTINGRPFILCARCMGIFIGIFLSVFLFISEIRFLWIFVLMLPLVIEGILQRVSSYQSNNQIRLLTGVLFGSGFVVIFGYINFYINGLFSFLGTLIISLF